MPKIYFYEKDNTGRNPTEDLAVVFVVGDCGFAKEEVASSDVGQSSSVQTASYIHKPDSNGCLYIPSSTVDLSQYITKKEYSGSFVDIDSYHAVEFLLKQGYGVIYYSTNPNGEDSTSDATDESQEQKYAFIPVSGVSDKTTNGLYTISVKTSDSSQTEEDEQPTLPTTTYEVNVATGYDSASTYYIRLPICGVTSALSEVDFSFLLDKNAYPIKFITTGNLYTVAMDSNYNFDFSVVNNLGKIATSRKDCSVLVDIDYNSVISSVNGNQLAGKFKEALEDSQSLPSGVNIDNRKDYIMFTYDAKGDTYTFIEEKTGSKALYESLCNSIYLEKVNDADVENIEDISSREYTLFTNCVMTENKVQITVPSSFVYLYAFAKSGSTSSYWQSMSGVNRGVVGNIFTPNIDVSKYVLDNAIITDGSGVSFNAVVDIKPYGYTIWGDRTLIEQNEEDGIKATSYMSLRNVISDIAKVAYDTAIANTYETNNDVTWLNVKSAISEYIDQIVTSNVLLSYDLQRVQVRTGDSRNTMAASITLYPLLPVENFEFSINLENAEITTNN